MISEPQWHTIGIAGPLEGFSAYVIECSTCGFEPENQLSIRYRRCPKCHSFTWHRVPRRGGPLVTQDRVTMLRRMGTQKNSACLLSVEGWKE